MKRHHAILASLAVALACAALAYLLTAYAFVPSVWRFVERRHPALDAAGTRALTSSGIPGDPLNVAFVGTGEALRSLLVRAHWTDADPVSVRSSVRIVIDSAAHREYDSAPVSALYVAGHRQDLAFEAPAGMDPSSRHHVRFWKMSQTDLLGRILWVGAATFDSGVGLSHTTGQVTHHIAANVDVERDKLVADLTADRSVLLQWVDDFQQQLSARNGGGDPYYTDGRLAMLSIDQ